MKLNCGKGEGIYKARRQEGKLRQEGKKAGGQIKARGQEVKDLDLKG